MRTAIDGVGRVVIPKALRDAMPVLTTDLKPWNGRAGEAVASSVVIAAFASWHEHHAVANKALSTRPG